MIEILDIMNYTRHFYKTNKKKMFLSVPYVSISIIDNKLVICCLFILFFHIFDRQNWSRLGDLAGLRYIHNLFFFYSLLLLFVPYLCVWYDFSSSHVHPFKPTLSGSKIQASILRWCKSMHFTVWYISVNMWIYEYDIFQVCWKNHLNTAGNSETTTSENKLFGCQKRFYFFLFFVSIIQAQI